MFQQQTETFIGFQVALVSLISITILLFCDDSVDNLCSFMFVLLDITSRKILGVVVACVYFLVLFLHYLIEVSVIILLT